MNPKETMADSTPTMSFETFWEWITSHPNCILRAGTAEAVLFDDDDFHWHFATAEPGSLLVQVIRGKRLVGEMVIAPQQVAFVQGVLADQEGEFVFELVSGDESSQTALYFFVLTHAFEARDELDSRRIH